MLIMSNSLLPTLHRSRRHARLLVRTKEITHMDLHLNLSNRTNYGCLLHATAPAIYIVPLSLQALPAV